MEKYIGFILVLLLASKVLAQESNSIGIKKEIEKGIGASDFPPAGLLFVDAFKNKKRLRFYEQNTSGELAFESKFIYEGRKFSIEFDTLGLLTNVEVEMKWEEIEKATRRRIQNGFDQHFERYKLIKIQKKWVHEEEEDDFDQYDIEEFLAEFSPDRNKLDDFELAYEIEISGKRLESQRKNIR
ncbi:MAG: hypothetical protein WD398_15565 [Cyclobacteriaceae bacterium]